MRSQGVQWVRMRLEGTNARAVVACPHSFADGGGSSVAFLPVT